MAENSKLIQDEQPSEQVEAQTIQNDEQPTSYEEKLNGFREMKQYYTQLCQYKNVDECERLIQETKEEMMGENLKTYCQQFKDACNELYQNYLAHFKKYTKKIYHKERKIRSEISAKFVQTRSLHRNMLAQFDDQFFEQFIKMTQFNDNDPEYNQELERSRKLASVGSYEEATKLKLQAEERHNKLLSLKEEELKKNYNLRAQMILEAQAKEIKQLKQVMNRRLSELEISKNSHVDVLVKTLRAELAKIYKKYLENLNKHFLGQKIPESLKPAERLLEFYNKFLVDCGLMPPPIKKLSEEKEKKEKASPTKPKEENKEGEEQQQQSQQEANQQEQPKEENVAQQQETPVKQEETHQEETNEAQQQQENVQQQNETQEEQQKETHEEQTTEVQQQEEAQENVVQQEETPVEQQTETHQEETTEVQQQQEENVPQQNETNEEQNEHHEEEAHEVPQENVEAPEENKENVTETNEVEKPVEQTENQEGNKEENVEVPQETTENKEDDDDDLGLTGLPGVSDDDNENDVSIEIQPPKEEEKQETNQEEVKQEAPAAHNEEEDDLINNLLNDENNE